LPGEGNKPYGGRWVARLRGKIIAQGGTPEQARRTAHSRYKETPEIVFMPVEPALRFPALLDTVRKILPEGQPVYLVGGAVRDLLLGQTCRDLDFAVEREAIKIARRIADQLNADFYALDTERDTGRVIFTGEDGKRTVMDFATFRGPDLEADLFGRDFTMNAIAIDLRDNSIHDPLGGAQDLKDKRLRLCSPSAFADDPVRILRGVRLAANFSFTILPDTRKAMKAAAKQLGNVSAERMRDELFHILGGRKPAASLRALDLLGALEAVLPELSALKGVEQSEPHIHDVWEHTLAVVGWLDKILETVAPQAEPENADDLFTGLLVMRLGRFRENLSKDMGARVAADRSMRSLLFLCTLFHDVAKPQAMKLDEDGRMRFWDHEQQGAELAATRGRHLALSNIEIQRLETVIRNHMRIIFHTKRLVSEGKVPSRRAVYRFFRDTGASGVEVCLLSLADLRATYEETLPQENWTACLDVVRTLLENWYEKRSEIISPPGLVDGDELMRALKLDPGKQIGELLEVIREGQAMGEVSTVEQALELARKRMAEADG
jgi:poly(A) polymerase